MNILYVYADNPREWNSSQWRCIIPARGINLLPGWSAETVSLREWLEETPKALAASQKADLIVVERLLIANVMRSVEYWKAQGKILVADLDDSYHWMPPSVASYAFWHKGEVEVEHEGKLYRSKLPYRPLEQLEWGLKLVHAITSPSRVILEDWRDFNPHRYLLPNYLDATAYLQARMIAEAERRARDEVVIGWGGSLTHWRSFRESGALTALNRVAKARPQVRVLIAGGDRRIFESLSLPEKRKALIPWTHYAEWPAILSRFDIGVMPLYGHYDQRRSWVKAVEYMVMGIPWVGSDMAPYQGVTDGGILVQNQPKSWEAALLHVIDHLDEYRQRLQADPLTYKRVDIEFQARRLAQVYTQIQQHTSTPILENKEQP